MENSIAHVTNLSKICRACLTEHENMKSIYKNQENLFEMFITISNIEGKDVTSIPSPICIECEEKLSLSYNFREQCRKSNELLLLQHISIINGTVKTSANTGSPETVKAEDVNENSDTSDYEPETKKTNSRKKTKNIKHSKRLTQYSFHEVSQAIEASRKKFFKNTACIRCGFIVSNTRALSVHISHLHKDLKGRWCIQCNKEFDNLNEHTKIHENEDLKCQFCGKIFHAKGHLTEHLRSHSGIRPYKCDVCSKCFISQRHLKVHFRIHTNERPYKCNLCSKSFIQYNSLKNHLKQHEKIGDKYFCSTCNQSLLSREALEGHSCSGTEAKTETDMQAISPELQNFCRKCDKKVRSLKEHIRQNHADNLEMYNEYGDNVVNKKLCMVCGKQFKNSTKLRVHMRVHTGETPYKCSYCDKRVPTRNQLVVHERVHTGERPHVCHVCGKGFAQSSVLNTHMRIHTGRPEVCKICEQRFCRPAELRLHMRKHTGEKPYLCTECGQAFIQRSHLVEHNKTHSDLRPYQCVYCDKAFKQNSSLKSHIQIHLGQKPFKCSQCPYACRQSYSLTLHMRQHAVDAPRPDRPHMCMICNKSFSTVAMLSSHATSVHQVNASLFE